jgi:hypothetical protein
MRTKRHSKLGRRAGEVAEDVVDAGRRATGIRFAASRREAVDGGSVRLGKGYVAGLWIH